MKVFRKILFPVDFSEVSPKIAPWVLTMANQFKAEVHLLFVARRLEHFAEMYVTFEDIQNFQTGVIHGAERNMDEFEKTYFKEYPNCKTKVVLGDIAEEILKYAKGEEIDLIIMGTHGRKGLNRIVFGSIADRIIKMSPIPVLSINPYGVGDLEK